MYPAVWRGYFFQMIDDDNDKTFHLQFNNLTLDHYQGVNKITGEGKDQNGLFTIEGQQQEGLYVFTYKSGEKSLIFKGQYDHKSKISGQHGKTLQSVGEGNFVIQKIDHFQGWNGYYSQYDILFQMKFQKLEIQIQGNNKVLGNGSDTCGDFKIEGDYSPQNNEVVFKKTYQNGVSWIYAGIMNNNEINGMWGYSKQEPSEKFKLYYLN